jgi:tetratricopeptide (TPR) repeat protein
VSTYPVAHLAPYLIAMTMTVGSFADTVAVAQPNLVREARRLDQQGKEADAIALFQRALDADPGSFDAHYGIARSLDLVDRYDEARQHFKRALELAPEAQREQTLRMLGISYAFTGAVNEAASYFQQVFDRRLAVNNFAGAAEEANELGRVYLESGNPDQAFKWYRSGYDAETRRSGRSAVEVDLTDFRWAHAQGRIAARRGLRAEALKHIAAVKSLLDKGHINDEAIQLPYLVGYVDFYLKDYTAALDQLKHADQGDPFILVLQGQAYERTGNASAARASYQKALASTSHAVNNAFARRIIRQRLQRSTEGRK